VGIKGLAERFASLRGKSQSLGAVLAGGEMTHYLYGREEQLFSLLQPFIAHWAIQKFPRACRATCSLLPAAQPGKSIPQHRTLRCKAPLSLKVWKT